MTQARRFDFTETQAGARGSVVIRYYRKSVWGNELAYCADREQAALILRLTGKRTIDGATRELLRDLSGGAIAWQEVIAP